MSSKRLSPEKCFQKSTTDNSLLWRCSFPSSSSCPLSLVDVHFSMKMIKMYDSLYQEIRPTLYRIQSRISEVVSPSSNLMKKLRSSTTRGQCVNGPILHLSKYPLSGTSHANSSGRDSMQPLKKKESCQAGNRISGNDLRKMRKRIVWRAITLTYIPKHSIRDSTRYTGHPMRTSRSGSMTRYRAMHMNSELDDSEMISRRYTRARTPSRYPSEHAGDMKLIRSWYSTLISEKYKADNPSKLNNKIPC